MFKKFLMVLGGIFLALLVAAALSSGYFYIKGTSLDKESEAYANVAVPAMVSGWDYNQLLDRAHPKLLSVMPQGSMEKIFEKLKTIGKLKTFNGCKGESNFHYMMNEGLTTNAIYLCSADFEQAPAVIKLTLIKDPERGWQVAGMYVDSKFFSANSK